MILHFLSTLSKGRCALGAHHIHKAAAKMSVTSYPGVQVSLKDGLRIIRLDSPKRKNAINFDMYQGVILALKEAAEDPNTHITALTGTGDYYSSGNDLSSMTAMTVGDEDGIMAEIKKAAALIRDFVNQFILFPKVLVAVVNGPAIGIAVTTLTLCDIVYCTDKATFSTPFVKLAFTPEGCSSHTFPKIMGQSLASEVLFFNRVLSSYEALSCGLVSRIEPNLDQNVWPYLQKLAKESNPIAMGHGKRLVRRWDKELLLKVNDAELERLEERWTSEDFFQSMIDYFAKKSKM